MENILAAKVWHSQFSLDEYVPDKMVSFQKGKKIEESELKAGLVWCEVSEQFNYVNLAVQKTLYTNSYLGCPQ